VSQGKDLRTYFLNTTTGEQGPLTEEQVAQLFANGSVNRDTPCKVPGDADWKTIDDFMPMLKYGTQLPNPTVTPVVRSEDPPIYRSSSTPPQLPQGKLPTEARVSVVDFDLPFVSILRLMFKWMAAALIVAVCFVPVVMLIVFVVMAIFGTLIGGLLSGFHHP
jgi:hypothetical protein